MLEPLKVKLEFSFPHDSQVKIQVSNIPSNDSAGTHHVQLTKEIWIEKTDFKKVKLYSF